MDESNKTKGSPVANSVFGVDGIKAEPHRGAMQLRGYLEKPQKPDDSNVRRLFTDDSFTRWIAFDNNDLLHHIPGGTDPCCPMGAIWIKREAIVTVCAVGLAHIIAAAAAGGGPTPPWRGPTPPWGGPTPPFG